MVDLNKDKDLKKYKNQNQWPLPSCFDTEFGRKPSPEVDLEFLWQLSSLGDAKEAEAKSLWENYL